MKKILQSGLALLLGVGASSALAALDRTGDFALLDGDGGFHQLSRYQHREAVAIMSYAQDCAGMPAALEAYAALQRQYTEQGIEFLLLDSSGSSRQVLADIDAGMPVLHDEGRLVAEMLGMAHVGEVRVLNPSRLSLYYRGGAGAELDSLLSSLLTSRVRNTVSVEGTGAGCELQFPERDAHLAKVPDYSTEVAPLIVENCVQCHRQWGAAPFPMDSHVSLLGWSPMIKEVLLNKRMPPAQVDPLVGHSSSARYLDVKDIQTIVHWINAGGPRGDGAVDPLEQLVFDQDENWLLGEPDLIVSTPTHLIPANGVLEDIYEDVDLGLEEGKWVKAIQFMPTANGTLHHLMVMVTAPGEDFWGAERGSHLATRRFLEGYSPGKPVVTEFNENTGVFIPAGHKLSMQFQYVGMGAEVRNVTKIGLYFADEPPASERMVQAVSTSFTIPPNTPTIPVHAEHEFDHDVVITGVRARMNERGKNMKFSVEFPDGRRQELLSVAAYNYAWQPHYVLDEPVEVPAGSTVHVTGAFDNSVSNPFNPDPTESVAPGLDITDEMFTGYFSYYPK